jgi:hypothetical protein
MCPLGILWVFHVWDYTCGRRSDPWISGWRGHDRGGISAAWGDSKKENPDRITGKISK